MIIKTVFKNDILKSIFMAARTCFNKGTFDDLEKEYSYYGSLKLFNTLLQHEHLSVFEHGIYQFTIENVSRSFLAQLSRHRIGISISVKSQHYIKHSNFNYKNLETNNLMAINRYNKLMNKIEDTYNKLISIDKLPHYIAREVLPNSTYCNIFITINLRALINFIKLRVGPENTPEIRLFCKNLYKHIYSDEIQIMKAINEKYDFVSKFI